MSLHILVLRTHLNHSFPLFAPLTILFSFLVLNHYGLDVYWHVYPCSYSFTDLKLNWNAIVIKMYYCRCIAGIKTTDKYRQHTGPLCSWLLEPAAKSGNWGKTCSLYLTQGATGSRNCNWQRQELSWSGKKRAELSFGKGFSESRGLDFMDWSCVQVWAVDWLERGTADGLGSGVMVPLWKNEKSIGRE